VLSALEPDLTAAKLQVYSFSTCLFSLFDSDFINPVEGVFKNYKDISNVDYLFVPLVYSSHFSCIVVENLKAITADDEDGLRNVLIHHLDSMVGSHNQERSVNIVKHFLISKLGVNDQIKNRIRAISSLGQLPTPQQNNSWDCGLFVSENIKHFLLGALSGKRYDSADNFKFPFSQSDISKNRLILYEGLQSVFDQQRQEIGNNNNNNNNVIVLDFNIIGNNTTNNLLPKEINTNNNNNNNNNNSNNNNNNNNNKISVLCEEESKKWDSSRESNTVDFFGNTTRTYILFKLPLQCINAPSRVLLYYRQGYEAFTIYAHFEVDAVVLRGKAYFSMCALYSVSCGSNFILVAIAFTTCTAPVRRYWVYDRSAKRFLEWNDKQISSYSCVPTIDFDEPAMIQNFRDYLICERKLYDVNRGIKFVSKNAAKSNDDIPDLDKFDGFDESHAVWKGPRDPKSWQMYLDMTGIY
jgi:hypothetical protein